MPSFSFRVATKTTFSLVFSAAQEVAVRQHTEQPLGPQAVLEHLRSTVDVREPSVLEGCGHLAGQASEGLVQSFGESLVHRLSGLVITEETQISH